MGGQLPLSWRRHRRRHRCLSRELISMGSTLVVMLVAMMFLGGAEARSPHPPPLRRVHHPERSTLQILPRISPSSARPRSYAPPSPHPSLLRHDDTVHISLSLPNLLSHSVELLLTPTEHLLHPDARVTRNGQNDQHLRPEDFRLYEGQVIDPDWVERIKWHQMYDLRDPARESRAVLGSAAIMVHNTGRNGQSPLIEGSFAVDNEVYQIISREKYERVRKPGDVEVSANHNDDLVIFRHADMVHDGDVSPHMCAHDKLPLHMDPTRSAWVTGFSGELLHSSEYAGQKRQGDTGGQTGSSNFINSIGSTQGCPGTQQILYMGIAADCTYVQQYGSAEAARTQILNTWNQASALYKRTFNVSLGITELVVQDINCPTTTPSDASWNVPCSTNVTLDERLSRFSQWRGNSRANDGNGAWHLMTNCPTDSEVGVAWLDALCQQTSTQISGGNWVSSAGVSTAMTTEWSLVSHEIGHNFGAIHDCLDGCSLSGSCCPFSQTSCSADGRFIMNPTTSTTEQAFSGCTLGTICQKIPNYSCLQAPSTSRTVISLQQCGNGIVEAGEDCDPGANATSTCCDPSTCKFVSGAVCDPSNSACCTGQCQYASAGTVCRASVNAQCDPQEVCTGTNSTCPNDVHTADGTSCGSNGLACADGQCTSLNLQCQTKGASLNLTTTCPQKNDRTCMVACLDPGSSNQCTVLQTPLLDGSPCGYGGHCYNGTCASGSWQDTAAGWYRENLQIAIPVTVVVGIIVLLILFGLVRCLFRCRRRPRHPSGAVVPPMRQARFNGPGGAYPAAVPGRHAHTDSVSSQSPITGAHARDDSQTSFEQNFQPRQSGYGRNAYGAPSNGGDYTQPGGGAYPDHAPSGYPQRGWVDPTTYNGPDYGRRETYGY